jgi:hypothetical protein
VYEIDVEPSTSEDSQIWSGLVGTESEITVGNASQKNVIVQESTEKNKLRIDGLAFEITGVISGCPTTCRYGEDTCFDPCEGLSKAACEAEQDCKIDEIVDENLVEDGDFFKAWPSLPPAFYAEAMYELWAGGEYGIQSSAPELMGTSSYSPDPLGRTWAPGTSTSPDFFQSDDDLRTLLAAQMCTVVERDSDKWDERSKSGFMACAEKWTEFASYVAENKAKFKHNDDIPYLTYDKKLKAGAPEPPKPLSKVSPGDPDYHDSDLVESLTNRVEEDGRWPALWKIFQLWKPTIDGLQEYHLPGIFRKTCSKANVDCKMNPKNHPWGCIPSRDLDAMEDAALETSTVAVGRKAEAGEKKDATRFCKEECSFEDCLANYAGSGKEPKCSARLQMPKPDSIESKFAPTPWLRYSAKGLTSRELDAKCREMCQPQPACKTKWLAENPGFKDQPEFEAVKIVTSEESLTAVTSPPFILEILEAPTRCNCGDPCGAQIKLEILPVDNTARKDVGNENARFLLSSRDVLLTRINSSDYSNDEGHLRATAAGGVVNFQILHPIVCSPTTSGSGSHFVTYEAAVCREGENQTELEDERIVQPVRFTIEYHDGSAAAETASSSTDSSSFSRDDGSAAAETASSSSGSSWFSRDDGSAAAETASSSSGSSWFSSLKKTLGFGRRFRFRHQPSLSRTPSRGKQNAAFKQSVLQPRSSDDLGHQKNREVVDMGKEGIVAVLPDESNDSSV